MEWHGPIRQRNIDVAEELYNEFHAAAKRRGLKLYQAFAQAMEQWIESNTRKRPDSVGGSREGIAPATDLSHADITAGLTVEAVERVRAFARLQRVDDPELPLLTDMLLRQLERANPDRTGKDKSHHDPKGGKERRRAG
jgi:hypothetical protein